MRTDACPISRWPRLAAAEGNGVTIDRPLRFPIGRERRPALYRYAPTGREVGIENLTFEFPVTDYRGHFTELGYNPIALEGGRKCDLQRAGGRPLLRPSSARAHPSARAPPAESARGAACAPAGLGRPFLGERLERVLAETRPDLVFASYGMNDGASLPAGDESVRRFREAMEDLRAAAKRNGAREVVHLTPPVYDATANPGAADYDPVLARFSACSSETRGSARQATPGPG